MLQTPMINLILDTYLIFSDGYGYAAIQFASALDSFPDVNFVIPAHKLHIDRELPQPIRSAIRDNIQEFHDFKKINFRTPPLLMDEMWSRELLYWYTCWETTKIPTGWRELLNKHVLKLFVPTSSQVKIFREGGIEIPILVVPFGINNNHYYFLDRTRTKETYTFGFYATVIDHRKGVDVLVKAFCQEFPASKYPDVYLRLKGRKQFNWPESADRLTSDSRISIDQRISSVKENLAFLEQLDCFVFPTRGEGFGLPPLEAMASGLPVIATNWSGPEDYMSAEFSFPLQYKLAEVNMPTRNPLYSYTGYWAEPDLEHLQYLMRYCYQNRQEARIKGENAAKYVANVWSWKAAAKNLIDSL